MTERPPDHHTIHDDAWYSVIGDGFDWLKSVLYGEFADHQSISTIVAQMLINFVPAAVIVTSARDAVAIILRLAAHPEKREDLMEWVLLGACLIVLALPTAMAVAGAVAGGVAAGVGAAPGAAIGGIAGSELGAALRAVMLMLIKETPYLIELIRFLQKFIKGDILKFLRLVKFVKYEKLLLSTFKNFTGQLIEMVRSLRLHLEGLRYFDSVKSTIVKLTEWERRYYAVQEDALKQMPKALALLDSMLDKLLAQTISKEMHVVPAGVAVDKTTATVPAVQRLRDTPGNILMKVEAKAPVAHGAHIKATAAKSDGAPTHIRTKQTKEFSPNPLLKEKPEPLLPHDTGANTKKQQVAEPTSEVNDIRAQTKFGNIPESVSTSSGISIRPTPGTTTTILGSYAKDMDNIINGQLRYPKTTDFGPKSGGFNVLNVPDEMYKTPDQFWNEINKPFLDAAIHRGDSIPLATRPTPDLLYRDDGSLTGFGREVQHLIQNGYRYDVATGKMIPGKE